MGREWGRYSPVFLDIETYETEDQTSIDVISRGVSHPKNMTKKETIEKWEKEKKPEEVKKAIQKTALDGSYGRVGCVGIKSALGESIMVSEGHEEDVLLSKIAGVLEAQAELESPPVIVGFNILGFDIPFLRKRFVLNGLAVPEMLRVDTRPWSDDVIDCMVKWDSQKWIGQSELARLLGLEVPESAPSAQMPELILAGKWEEVRKHQQADITVLEAIHTRMGSLGMFS